MAGQTAGLWCHHAGTAADAAATVFASRGGPVRLVPYSARHETGRTIVIDCGRTASQLHLN